MNGRHRVNIKQVLDERNARDEESRISRIREIQELDNQGGFHAFFLDFETTKDLDNEDAVYDALAEYVDGMWNEACWCYIWGTFRACIVLAVGAVEAGLKYRLREAGQLEDKKDATFGTCIKKAKQCGVLPGQQTDLLLQSSWELNRLRNDILHANRARRDPDGALSFDGPEHETIKLGHGIESVVQYQPGARVALNDSRTLLVYLRAAGFTA